MLSLALQSLTSRHTNPLPSAADQGAPLARLEMRIVGGGSLTSRHPNPIPSTRRGAGMPLALNMLLSSMHTFSPICHDASRPMPPQAAAGTATTLHTGVVKGTKGEGPVPLYHIPYDGAWHPSDRQVRRGGPVEAPI